MNVELMIVLAMTVLLLIAVALNERFKKKDSNDNNNPVNNYVETKTMEMPIVDF